MALFALIIMWPSGRGPPSLSTGIRETFRRFMGIQFGQGVPARGTLPARASMWRSGFNERGPDVILIPCR